MKIAQIISTPPFAWATGGCARVAYELSKELVKKGHDVTMFTTDLYEPNQRYVNQINLEYIDGIRIFRFKYISNWLAWKNKIFISPRLILHLKNHLQEYDIVHLQDLISVHAIVTMIYCRKYNIPYLLTTHGSVPRLYEKNGLIQVYRFLFGNNIIKNASKVFALNKSEAEQCKAVGIDENKIEIVPNGINLSKYEKLPDRGVFRRKYGIKSNEKIVLYLGRMHKGKGIDLLVEAFSEISKELNDIKLVLVGPNDGNQELLVERAQKLEIDDIILFTGFVTDDEKIAAFMDADVFITPSFSGFPITFLEACACGTPIITTNNGDKLDWIHNKTGYVVEYNKDQLRDAVITMLNDDGLRQRFGEEGRRLVREEFRWDRIVEKIEMTYSNLLKT